MAPRPPVRREDFLRSVRSANVQLPLHAGWPHHSIAVCCESGVWRLRELIVDQPRCEALREARLAAHQPFMPEHAETCLIPGPKVLLEAQSLEEFCGKIESGPWPPW